MPQRFGSAMRFAIALGMSLGLCHGWIAADQRQLALVSGWAAAAGSATFFAPAFGTAADFSP
jgi:hypothetical protein